MTTTKTHTTTDATTRADLSRRYMLAWLRLRQAFDDAGEAADEMLAAAKAGLFGGRDDEGECVDAVRSIERDIAQQFVDAMSQRDRIDLTAAALAPMLTGEDVEGDDAD